MYRLSIMSRRPGDVLLSELLGAHISPGFFSCSHPIDTFSVFWFPVCWKVVSQCCESRNTAGCELSWVKF